MDKTFEAVFVKPEIGLEDLKKYGFREGVDYPIFAYWKPSFTCSEYEARQFYNEQTDYIVFIDVNKQIVIRPGNYTQISAKIQALLFDMITDGIVEKKRVQ